MHADEESSFNELGALMKKVRAVESIARHHEDAVRFHEKAGRNAELQAEKARTEARALRELYKVGPHSALAIYRSLTSARRIPSRSLPRHSASRDQ